MPDKEFRMKSRDKLFLYEEAMLLSLKDKEGTMESGAYYLTAMGGAILAELLLTKRIEVEEERKKKFARVISDKSLGDELLDECLQRIKESTKRQQLQTWVSRFAHTKNLKNRVILQLCRHGVLREDEKQVLLFFKRKIYPEVDPKPERKVIERLDKSIFGGGNVDSRTVVLVAIAHNANLLKNAFDKKRLKERKARIERIVSGDAAGAATKEVIEATQAAVLVSTIVASTVATTVVTTTITS